MVEDAFGHVSICSTVLPSYWQEQYRVRSSMPWGNHCQVLPSITKYCQALQVQGLDALGQTLPSIAKYYKVLPSIAGRV